MKIIVFNFIFAVITMSAHCDQLDAYYKKFDFTSDKCKYFLNRAVENLNDDVNGKRFKSVIADALSPKISEANFLRQSERFLSLSVNNENKYVFGFFYSEKLGGHVPYESIFKFKNDFVSEFTNYEGVSKKYDKVKEGEFQVLFFSFLNLSIMDLNDAILERGDLNHIARFRTLRQLGLPVRGIQFSEPFSFPPELETLVVRNTVLNSNFFDALNGLSKLKELIVVDCTVDLPKVKMDHFDLIDKKNTRLQAAPFHKISNNLERIQVLKSQPRIFDYIVTEKWTALHSLKVDVYSTASGFATFVHPTDGETSFPMLKNASIGISEKFSENAASILKIAKSRYPDIANLVRLEYLE